MRVFLQNACFLRVRHHFLRKIVHFLRNKLTNYQLTYENECYLCEVLNQLKQT